MYSEGSGILWLTFKIFLNMIIKKLDYCLEVDLGVA